MAYTIGIDLGGTNIKAGIVDPAGKIIYKDRIKTGADRGPLEIVKDMGLLAQKAIRDSGVLAAEVQAIGIGAPGTTSNLAGTFIFAGNLPFRNTPVRQEFHKMFDLPVYVDNDANITAFAECVAGGARGTQHSVTITLGTGVGGGVIINRRIYSGFNNAGCEVGHMVICVGGEPCTCGRLGCFEAYASATALIRETTRAAKAHPQSLLNLLIAENGGKADGRTAFMARHQGDEAAERVIDSYIEILSEGLGNLVNLYMPEVILIGGGICNEGDALLVPVREKVKSKSFIFEGVAAPEIRLAEMGNDAGIVGAAMMARGCLDDGCPG